MSEHELYLIRQRMLSGKLAKAERGELAVPLPIGYARRPSGEVILDPDEQAQHVVRLVFGAFRRLGTLNSVLRYLVAQKVQLPVRVHSGPSKGELEWRRPTRETLQNMLHNPAYAGYYAYGRRQVEPRRKIPGRPDTGRVVKDASEWLVLLPGRLPAYITQEEHEANIARMAANRQTAAAPGAPRDGAALLSGLLRCGRCGGHRMTVSYHDVSAGPPTATPAPFTRPTTGPAAGASTSPARRSMTTSPARSSTRWRRPRWRSPWPPPPRSRTSGPCWTSYGGSALSAPAMPPAGPPPVPARRAGEPARRPAAGSGLGGRARRDGPAGSGLPAVRRGTADGPHRGRAGGDPGPGRIFRPSGTPRRPRRPTARNCCGS